MEVSKELFCRLCMNTVSKENFTVIDESIREILKTVSLNPNLDNNYKHVMCNTCSMKLYSSFNFKSTCLHIEDKIVSCVNSKVPFVDLRELYLKENENKPLVKMEDNQKICRLCLQLIWEGFMSLYDVKLEIISRYIPEVNFAVTEDPVICRQCLDSLAVYDTFIRTCLNFATTIHNIADNKITSFGACNMFIKSENNEKDGHCEKIEFVCIKEEQETEGKLIKTEEINLKFEGEEWERMAARWANLRSAQSVTRALEESDVENAAEDSCSNSDNEEFIISLEERPEEMSAEESDSGKVEEVCGEIEEDEDFDEEAEPANKVRRVMDAVRQRSTDHPRKSVPASKGPMTWSENVPAINTRSSSDIPSFSPAPQYDASNITSPLEGFKVLFTDGIINLIVLHTNARIAECLRDLISQNHVVQSYHAPTDNIEIEAYIGVNFYAGVYKDNKQDVTDMFSYDCGRPVYNSTFSLQRFKFLTSCLRFDDVNTRVERRQQDKLAPVREIWDLFIGNCQRNYLPSNNVTIDEQLVSFRGKCTFRIYMKNKPDKYGLLIYTMNDSNTFYCITALPYVGKVTPEENDGVPTCLVKTLVEQAKIAESGRTITMDNYFTSTPLFTSLLAKHLFAVGTIRKNKREIPATLKAPAPAGSSRFVFTEELTLVSYTPKKNKIVLLLSSLHHDNSVDNFTKKPIMALFYNKYKGTADAMDKNCRDYSTARHTRRWPLRFFYNMLDIAGLNACILHNLIASNAQMRRSDFTKNLARSLIEPMLRRRLQVKTLRSSIKLRIARMLQEDEPVADNLTVIREDTRAKCHFCKPTARGRTRIKCPNCMRRMCDEHRAPLCVECVHNMD